MFQWFVCQSSLISCQTRSENVPSVLALANYFLRRWMDFWLECSDLAISSLPAPTVENSLRKSFHAVLELIRHSVYWVQKRQASARPRDWCFCLYCCVFEQQNALTRQSEATLRQRVSEPLVTYNDLLVNTAGESIRFHLILHVVAVRGRFHQRWMNLNNLAEQKLRKKHSSFTGRVGCH